MRISESDSDSNQPLSETETEKDDQNSFKSFETIENHKVSTSKSGEKPTLYKSPAAQTPTELLTPVEPDCSPDENRFFRTPLTASSISKASDTSNASTGSFSRLRTNKSFDRRSSKSSIEYDRRRMGIRVADIFMI